MSVPTSYTEESLADLMHTSLGDVATVLGYSSPESYTETLNDALLAYGTDDVTTISGPANLIKLRALAKVCAWRKAVGDLATRFNYKADGGDFSRNQMFESAKKTLEAFETLATAYDANYAVQNTRGRSKHDPYQYIPEEERA